MEFEFATAGRIVFGPGRAREVGGIVRGLGRRALLVTGASAAAAERAAPVRTSLASSGVDIAELGVLGEPTVDGVAAGAARARADGCDVVVGVGGGSVLDAAKAIAAMVINVGPITEYLEVIGKGAALPLPGAPMVAVPTTAGTGAEATRNAVLGSPEHRVKVSLRSPFLLARAAVVDPLLALGLPPSLTASTGLDALTQLIEPFVSPRATPFTDALCREGLRRAARSLEAAVVRGTDLAAREDMALASLSSGIALANAGLGAVHGFAGPIGGMFGAAHGEVCAALLGPVMAANVRALESRDPGGEALRRYAEVAAILTGGSASRAHDAVHWVERLCQRLGVPRLGALGVCLADFPDVVGRTQASSSVRANPIVLSTAELSEILTRAVTPEA